MICQAHSQLHLLSPCRSPNKFMWLRTGYEVQPLTLTLKSKIDMMLKKHSATNHERTQLAEKLKVAENGRKSAKAGLKSAEAQAEDQRKELYMTQLNLATEKATVLDLQAKLKKH